MKVKLTTILLILLLLVTSLGISDEMQRAYLGCDETFFGAVGFLNFFGIPEQLYEPLLCAFERSGKQENQLNILRLFRSLSIVDTATKVPISMKTCLFIQLTVLLFFFAFYQLARTSCEDGSPNNAMKLKLAINVE